MLAIALETQVPQAAQQLGSQDFQEKDMQRQLIIDAIYAQLYSLTNKQLSQLLQELSDLPTNAKVTQK